MAVTNAELNNSIKGYLSDVKKCLLCDRKTKSRFLKDLGGNIDNYLSDVPDADFDNIIEHFGTPKSIAEEFAAQTDTDLLRKAKRNKNLKWVIIAILAAIALFIGIIAIIIVKNNSRDSVYYYDETITDNGIVEESLED